jgi:hypothetical protein
MITREEDDLSFRASCSDLTDLKFRPCLALRSGGQNFAKEVENLDIEINVSVRGRFYIRVYHLCCHCCVISSELSRYFGLTSELLVSTCLRKGKAYLPLYQTLALSNSIP